MPDQLDEIPLRGGRVTPGIVRVGDTVRRPHSPNSAFVTPLLQHLADRGFEGAPVPLGRDELGRDVLSFINGDVPAELGFHEDATLSKAARLIRRFHDLGAEWLGGSTAGDEVVCHNDLSPCNAVFRSDEPVALIDFDAAAPGSRASDLGYAAWLWLDIGSPDIEAADQGRRLGLFLDAYGMADRDAVLAQMRRRQTLLAEEGLRRGDRAMAEWASACLRWTEVNATTLVRA